jgi:selenocysteine lyase/cysteine desulfurase
MAFPAWKWLMGPLGLGVLYVPENKLDSLQPTFVGPDSVVQSESYLPYKSELKPGADRFSFSTASINDLVHFQAALEFLESIGFEKVRKRLFQLSEHLVKGLRQIGFHVLSDEFPEHPSGIVAGENPRISSDLIFSHLKKNDIVAAKRLGSIRFSPHIYISHEQIDKVIRTLSRI